VSLCSFPPALASLRDAGRRTPPARRGGAAGRRGRPRPLPGGCWT